MRLILVNYRYFVSGGPERYMFAVSEMLERAGHEVVPFSVAYSRNRETPWSEYFVKPIAGDDEVYFRDHSWSPRSLGRGLQRAFYAPDVSRSVSRLVTAARPDVALVQHYLRKLSPSVLVGLKRAGVPIVVRLSDFGMVCPGGLLLREKQICRRCVTNGMLSSVRYRCVQGSLGVSAVACASLLFAKWRKYFDLVDYFVTPSTVLREQMIEGGYDGARIVVLPTFVEMDYSGESGVRDRRIVYVGRLSPEKGIEVLLDAYECLQGREGLGDVELLIAGEGEAGYTAQLVSRGQQISSRVRFLGMLNAEAVRQLLSGALLSVVPSLWYENTPNAVLESLAAGTPVVASDLGSMGEMLRGGDAGFLFRPGDPNDLANHLEFALLRPDVLVRMGRAARMLAESRYSPDLHISGLLNVLERAMGRAAGAQDQASGELPHELPLATPSRNRTSP
ncbi:MAG: glycosyltransferase family 4 protein [Armatimonadetes bacterium]|nr:glycosyltransferase family 4 protein [Armatimonadota bacterium]